MIKEILPAIGFMEAVLIAASLFILSRIIKEMTRHLWAGKVLRKPVMKGVNYSFYFWFVLWFLWIYFSFEWTKDVLAVMQDSEPAAAWQVSDLVRRGTTNFFWILLGVLNLIRLHRQPEIRENGFFTAEGFTAWENLKFAQWDEFGHLLLLFKPAGMLVFSREIRRIWKVHPDEIVAVQQIFQTYAKDCLGQQLEEGDTEFV